MARTLQKTSYNEFASLGSSACSHWCTATHRTQTRCWSLIYLNPDMTSSHHVLTSKRRARQKLQVRSSREKSHSKKKIANLFVQHNQRVALETHTDTMGQPKPISKFLCQPAGMESMLNIRALQSYEYLGHNIFRCTLPKIELLNFEVAPVVELSVVANEHDCIVEMLSCKFRGSELLEKQNEHFTASMRNHLTWDLSSEEEVLDVKVELNVSLEVYTLPFSLLPVSAVETPGNVILQALVDQLVPIFLQQLMNDYRHWAQSGTESVESDTTLTVNSPQRDASDLDS